MQHTIRPLHEDDFPRSWYLGSHAFRGGAKDTSWRDNPNRHTRREWGLFEHDTMQARLALIPFTLQMGPDLQLAMGGIAGVVGAPAGRGRGYAGTLVRESLGWMREAGQCVSMLFPFSYSFYSRLGWEWVGENRTYTVKPRHLPKSRHSERVREASDADRPTVEACYAEFSRGYRGMIVRTPKHWNLVWEDGKDTFTYRYVYEVDGVVEGYLLHTGTKRRKVWIDEFICTTQRARFGLLALLKRHDMQIDRFEWEAPQDDSLWSAEMHHGYKTRLEPKCQARIVDITAAFSALRPDPHRRKADG
jgi:predicted acetyltransferase